MKNDVPAANDNSISGEAFFAEIVGFSDKVVLGLKQTLKHEDKHVHSTCVVEVIEAGWTTTRQKFPEATGGLKAAETITILKPEIKRMVRQYFSAKQK